MDYNKEENKLEIILPEVINGNNAGQVQDEIMKIVDQNPDSELEFECAKLKYLSSAGLRALLTVKKKRNKEITLKNVGSEINKILEMTGFDNIFTVRVPVPACDITGCEKIYSGINGSMYRKRTDVMVKVYREDMSLQDVEQELDMTKKSLALGIPTLITFLIVRCGDSYGIMSEEIHGDSVTEFIRKNPDRVEETAVKFARFTKRLHSTEILPGALPDIKKRYKGWLDRMKGKINSARWEQLSNLVESMADCDTFIHGDLNPDNVFIDGDELMLMDMGSCGYGHPVFDLQALYASLVGIEIDDPGYCERTFGLDAVVCRRFWRAFIHEYINDLGETIDDRMVAKIDDKAVLIKETKLNQLLTQYYILKKELLNNMAGGK
ncbi:MAG: phosphotransferase [Eubacterium sp.]|nr:phosphotransferase [Eubacterium sp.]